MVLELEKRIAKSEQLQKEERKKKRGLFVGRFQPFHNGHLEAIKWILSQVEEVVIVVGSAQYSHSPRNPFTAGERIEMIRSALLEADVDPTAWVIVPVPDTDGVHATWVSLVKAYAPSFDVVFTNDPLTKRLFEEEGYEVVEVPLVKKEEFSGTRIRKLMIEGGDWEKLVPPAVAKFVKRIRGIERLREISA